MSALAKPNVETAQDAFELERLLVLVDEFDPRRILEIGVWHGGTLWHWLQSGRTVVGVDDTMYDADDWRSWADTAGAELTLIQGDSRDGIVIARVAEHAPFDLLFIDAAHDYASVRADWLNFRTLVAPGGLVVFHDIAPRLDYGVSELWAQIKSDARTIEIHAGTPGYCGIGVLWT